MPTRSPSNLCASFPTSPRSAPSSWPGYPVSPSLSPTKPPGAYASSRRGRVPPEEPPELESAFDAVKTIFDSATLDTLAALLGVIPNFEAAVKPLGAGAAVHLGGQFFA